MIVKIILVILNWVMAIFSVCLISAYAEFTNKMPVVLFVAINLIMLMATALVWKEQ